MSRKRGAFSSFSRSLKSIIRLACILCVFLKSGEKSSEIMSMTPRLINKVSSWWKRVRSGPRRRGCSRSFFFGTCDIIRREYAPASQTVTGQFYVGVLERLCGPN
ncbi:hypothetical protein Trydic_g19083 [Trypoxylus dichotomus]